MMFGWLGKRRPVRAIPDPLWQTVLARYPFLTARGSSDLARLRELAARFLETKEFHGAQDFVITDEVALAIAAQAVLPLLNLHLKNDLQSALRWYDDFVGIVVHREEVVAQRTVTDEAGVVHRYAEVLAGEAMDRGPVMLNWRDVDNAGATAGQGYNVVIHEFVHKIDMRDGDADGCPQMPTRARRTAWLNAITGQYEAFRERVTIAERFSGESPWLDSYGAHNISEYFAVACEAYFVNRERFGRECGPLLDLFDSFFNPDPPGDERL